MKAIGCLSCVWLSLYIKPVISSDEAMGLAPDTSPILFHQQATASGLRALDSCYNMISFLQNICFWSLITYTWGEVWGILWEFDIWCIGGLVQDCNNSIALELGQPALSHGYVLNCLCWTCCWTCYIGICYIQTNCNNVTYLICDTISQGMFSFNKH